MEIVLGVVITVLAGACNAVMDILSHKFKESIFYNKESYDEMFWNPAKSWRNKYKWNDEKFVAEPKFWGSTTFLVFTTDAWHLFQFFLFKLVFWLVVLSPSFSLLENNYLSKVLDFIILHSIFTFSFEICYSYIFRDNDTKV